MTKIIGSKKANENATITEYDNNGVEMVKVIWDKSGESFTMQKSLFLGDWIIRAKSYILEIV